MGEVQQPYTAGDNKAIGALTDLLWNAAKKCTMKFQLFTKSVQCGARGNLRNPAAAVNSYL